MGKTITYVELDAASRAFAAWLQSKGLQRGARVAIMMPNVLQYPVAIAGILRAGLTGVNVNPLYKPRELEFQLKDCGAEVIIVLENFASVLQEALPHTAVKHVVVASMGDMLGIGQGLAHAHAGFRGGVRLKAFLEHRHQRRTARRVNVGRYARRIILEPRPLHWPFHGVSPFAAGSFQAWPADVQQH